MEFFGTEHESVHAEDDVFLDVQEDQLHRRHDVHENEDEVDEADMPQELDPVYEQGRRITQFFDKASELEEKHIMLSRRVDALQMLEGLMLQKLEDNLQGLILKNLEGLVLKKLEGLILQKCHVSGVGEERLGRIERGLESLQAACQNRDHGMTKLATGLAICEENVKQALECRLAARALQDLEEALQERLHELSTKFETLVKEHIVLARKVSEMSKSSLEMTDVHDVATLRRDHKRLAEHHDALTKKHEYHDRLLTDVKRMLGKIELKLELQRPDVSPASSQLGPNLDTELSEMPLVEDAHAPNKKRKSVSSGSGEKALDSGLPASFIANGPSAPLTAWSLRSDGVDRASETVGKIMTEVAKKSLEAFSKYGHEKFDF